MGCWNKTCALSNLPIYHGEETYVFIIERNSGYGVDGGVYTHHMFLPCLLPFEATYDDYGAGENSKGVGLPWVLEGIRKNLIETHTYAKSDLSVNREEFDVDLLYTASREGVLFTKNYSGGQHRLHFVMMRKDVVDAVLLRYVYERYVPEFHKYVEYTFNDILNSVDEVINHSVKILEPRSKTSLFHILSPATLLLPGEGPNLASYWLHSLHGCRTGQSCIFDLWSVYADLIEKGNLNEAKELIVECLKGVCIDIFMDATRRSWSPPSGEGSQDECHLEHRLLANITLDTLTKLENDE